MMAGLHDWHKICSACDYEKATLNPTINQTTHQQELDEDARALALFGIRHLNFKRLVEQILRYIPAGSKLLDVGCAHGWFLQTARNQLKVEGIEPDKAIYQGAEKLGLSLRCRYFPETLTKLLVRSGFKVQAFGRLETIVLSGLFKRISYVGNNHWIINALLYLTVTTTLPILKLLPSDTLYVIATPERH